MLNFFKRGGAFDIALTFVERVFIGLSIVATFVIMFGVSLDATLRYGFGSPLSGVFEITEDYLLVAVVFLSLSYTYRAGWFIRVTAISGMLPASFKNIYERLCRLAALGVCILIVIGSADIAITAFENGEFSSNLLGYPLAPAYMIVPIGTAVLCLRLLQFTIFPPPEH